MINPLSTYQNSGEIAGKAARQRDYRLMSMQSTWMQRAVRLEAMSDKDYAEKARKTFEDAYRAEAMPERVG